jgi:hypothetical protein
MTSPPLAQTQPDGSRRYCHPKTAEVVPSVTTILRVIAKPNVTRWAARKAAEYALEHWAELEGMSDPEAIARISGAHEQISDVAKDIGNAVHEVAEMWGKGEAHEPARGTASYVNQLISFLMDSKPRFIENECTLWSRKHQYAGTADAIAEIDGKLYLLDFKTGKRVYEEAALQLSALANADFIIREDGTEEEIPALEVLAAVHVRPRSCRVIPVNHMTDNFAVFLACRRIVDWTDRIAPTVLGTSYDR